MLLKYPQICSFLLLEKSEDTTETRPSLVALVVANGAFGQRAQALLYTLLVGVVARFSAV